MPNVCAISKTVKLCPTAGGPGLPAGGQHIGDATSGAGRIF